VLNPDLTYGLCFLGFVITSTWALTLFHLRREMEDNLLVKHAADRASERVEVRRILESRRIVGGKFFLGTGLLSLGVFLGSAAAFLALPRVGIGFFLKTRGGLTLTGFSDGVTLGGHGVIKNDSTVVMRVEMDAAHGGRQAPYLHWRGVAFDQYEHGSWMRSRAAPSVSGRMVPSTPGRERWLWTWADEPMLADPDELDKTYVRQDIWLDPLDSDVLFGASTPRATDYGSSNPQRTSGPLRNNEIRVHHNSAIHYTMWSSVEPADPVKLRAAKGVLPPGYQVFLELPREITERTRKLARTITAGLTNEYDKAIAIQQWLDANLTYTLQLADPGSQEPVDFFLFDRKQGHCEYFASAFAILARAVGIPTRNVNGFLGGEWNEYKGYVAVRAGDAHSWDEVYFPGAGWATFDPTPPGDIDELGRGGAGLRARLGRLIDTLRFQWDKWVIEYDLASQLSLFKSIGHAVKDAATAVRDAVVYAGRGVARNWPIVAALALVLAAVLVLRRKRRPGDARVDVRGRPRTRSSIAIVYDQILRALAKAGIVREAFVTPRELAARMLARNDPAAVAVGELTELYYAAEWGGRRDPRADTRAAELAVAIRTALGEHRRAARSTR
jgi:hypothetical protein